MKKLVENLYQHRVPINEGYDYLFTDDVYLPIFQSSLIITKRIIMPISLVEEKVLQLLDIGIYQIDEIAKILGLNRRLLEVTLADLYSKDLVSASSNSCKLMTMGRVALNDLNRTEKKQDILKDIYIDGILGEIFDVSNYQLLDKVIVDDNKLKPIIPIGEVKCFVEKFKEISKIFDEENKIVFSEGVHPIKEELLKIDKVDNTFVKFIKISIHVYVSSNGLDIDVLAARTKMAELVLTYKDIILEQINQKKILKNRFKYRKVRSFYSGKIYLEKPELINELKNMHYKRTKKTTDYELLEEHILCTRKLFDGEYSELLKYLAQSDEKVELYIDNLEYWVYDSQFVSSLANILDKKKLYIYYAEAQNEQKSLKQLKWNYGYVEQCNKYNNEYYICWKFEQFILYGIPRFRKVINDNTSCIMVDYYLEKLNT